MRGISWLAEDLLASQEELCSVELGMSHRHFSLTVSYNKVIPTKVVQSEPRLWYLWNIKTHKVSGRTTGVPSWQWPEGCSTEKASFWTPLPHLNTYQCHDDTSCKCIFVLTSRQLVSVRCETSQEQPRAFPCDSQQDTNILSLSVQHAFAFT
jgi:hypothetical protein